MSLSRYFLYKKRSNGTYRQVAPTEGREGKILYNNNPDDAGDFQHAPMICVYHRNNWCWRFLFELPVSKWRDYRDKVDTNMGQLFNKLRHEINSHNVTKRKLKSATNVESKMFLFMWNKMSEFDRNEFLETYPDQKAAIEKNTCKICSNLYQTAKKCRHADCTGMCTNCHNDWKSGNSINKHGIFVFGHIANTGDNCPSCNKSQLYTCPICYDDFEENKVIKSDNCSHYICQSCFCNSFNSHPIVDCPMCRSQFKNTLSKTVYDDGFQEGPIVV
jgi:hypothetical protein